MAQNSEAFKKNKLSLYVASAFGAFRAHIFKRFQGNDEDQKNQLLFIYLKWNSHFIPGVGALSKNSPNTDKLARVGNYGNHTHSKGFLLDGNKQIF